MKFTRGTYKKIKSMDRAEMARFIDSIYNSGYEKGLDDMSHDWVSKLTDAVDVGIKETPGIGKKRYQDIMKNINKQLAIVTGSTETYIEEGD